MIFNNKFKGTAKKLLASLAEKYKGKTIDDLIKNAGHNGQNPYMKKKNEISENTEAKKEISKEDRPVNPQNENKDDTSAEKERNANSEQKIYENKIKITDIKFLLLSKLGSIFQKTYQTAIMYIPKLLLKSLMTIPRPVFDTTYTKNNHFGYIFLRYFSHIKNFKNYVTTMFFHQPNSITMSNMLMPLKQQAKKIKQSYKQQIRIFLMSARVEFQKQIRRLFNSGFRRYGFKDNLKKEYNLNKRTTQKKITIIATINNLWNTSINFIKRITASVAPMENTF